MDALLWTLVVLLALVGLAGVVLPALPGAPILFGAALLAAWIDDFQRIGGWTLLALGALVVLSWIAEWLGALLGAKRVGASRLAIAGAAIGAIAGIFTGFVGLLFLPLIGAAIGEYIARRDAAAAGRTALATWFGILLGVLAKIAIAGTMVGIAIAAYLV